MVFLYECLKAQITASTGNFSWTVHFLFSLAQGPLKNGAVTAEAQCCLQCTGCWRQYTTVSLNNLWLDTYCVRQMLPFTYPLLSCPNWSLAFSDEIMLEGFCWWGNQLISVSLTETITIQQNKKISCKITEEPKMYFEVASLQTVLDCDHVVTCCDTNRPVGCEM